MERRINGEKGKVEAKLRELLVHVCREGYVRYRGRWYRGMCDNPRQIECSKCNFAGCEVL